MASRGTDKTPAGPRAKGNVRSSGSNAPTPEQRDIAQYVADMVLQMRNMARGVKLHTITVPLEYAYREAFSVANRAVAPSAENERIKKMSRGEEPDSSK